MTAPVSPTDKQSPAKAAFSSIKPWFTSIAVFSAVINILMLTGAIYMLQLYDRVLVSKSIATLLGLSALALAAFAFQGFLNAVRSRMLVRVGARFDEQLSPHVFDLVSRRSLTNQAGGDRPYRDLERVRSFVSGAGPTAIFDMPFMPIFLIGCFILHPYLGLLAVGGGVVIIAMTLLTDRFSRRISGATAGVAAARHSLTESARRNAEAMVAMGFGKTMRDRWLKLKEMDGAGTVRQGEMSGNMGAVVKTFRQVLQSAVLGLGAYLAIFGMISPGAIIAASIMTSRALAPIETAIAHWKSFVDARESFDRLKDDFEDYADPADRTELPAPANDLQAAHLVVIPPGQALPAVKGVSLKVEKGSALAIFGQSGAGKSTLARAMVGLWPIEFGMIRIDGQSVSHYSPDTLGGNVGYLPQDVELFDGTVAENIARFDPAATSKDVVDAAMMAGAHDVILGLQNSYDTKIGEGGVRLSGGQRQRVALARALYGNPFLVVLDEPNSNLDGEGEAALNRAIDAVRKRGGVVVVITHRASVLPVVDQVAVMQNGRFEKYGAKDEIMPKVIKGGADSGGGAEKARPAAKGTGRNGKAKAPKVRKAPPAAAAAASQVTAASAKAPVSLRDRLQGQA
ncbi:MAG: type I secretion system permease/ATPase [Pseudomonadota bacterium]